MTHEMYAHPIWQIDPLPIEAEFSYGRMLREEDALLPFRRWLTLTFVTAYRSACRISDFAPRPLDLEKFDFYWH